MYHESLVMESTANVHDHLQWVISMAFFAHSNDGNLQMKTDFRIKGITWDHVRGYGPLYASVKPYKEKHGVDIYWEKRSLKDFGDASLEELALEYDLIVMDHPHAGVAAKTQAVIPLDRVLSKETLEDAANHSTGPSLQSYWYDSHLWALPIDAACQVASFRHDLLSQDLLPQTWDDVFKLADNLRSEKKFVGMALCATDCNCSFLTLCAQHGDPFEENKFIAESTGRWALGILKKIHKVFHPESIQWNPIRLYDYMSSENDVAYCPLAFGYSNYSRQGFSKIKLDFGPIPGKRNALLGGAGIAISKHCSNIQEAVAYVTFLCGENFQSNMYVEAGGQPAHKKAWVNPDTNNITGNFFANTLSTIENAYTRPRNTNWPLFQEECGEIICSFLKYDKEISAAWNEIKSSYRKYFPEKE
jgi:multiple sugar transport system substrate-binding protein